MKQQFSTLRAIALETMPGDQIRHSSWPASKAFTCSTEFLMAFGDYPYSSRPALNIKNMPTIGKGGTWEHAGKYPPRVNTVNRTMPRVSSVPHHVPGVKRVEA